VDLTTGSAGFAAAAATVSLPDSGTDAATEAPAYDDNASYAGHSTYRCDNGETLEVENSVTRVAVAGADGSLMELPASPADSQTRYVKDQYALVFDGDEALFFRPKAAPATCKR
jgi:membrane-bound inhibitor of C-type lysozyme